MKSATLIVRNAWTIITAFAVIGLCSVLANPSTPSMAQPAPDPAPASVAPTAAPADTATPEPGWYAFEFGGKTYVSDAKATPTPAPTPAPATKFRHAGFVVNQDGTPMPILLFEDGKNPRKATAPSTSRTVRKKVKTAEVPTEATAVPTATPTPTPIPTFVPSPTPEIVYGVQTGTVEEAVAATILGAVRDTGTVVSGPALQKGNLSDVFDFPGFIAAYTKKCQELKPGSTINWESQLQMMLADTTRRQATWKIVKGNYDDLPTAERRHIAGLLFPAIYNSAADLQNTATKSQAYGTVSVGPESAWIAELINLKATDPLAATIDLGELQKELTQMAQYIRADAGQPRAFVRAMRANLKAKQ